MLFHIFFNMVDIYRYFPLQNRPLICHLFYLFQLHQPFFLFFKVKKPAITESVLLCVDVWIKGSL